VCFIVISIKSVATLSSIVVITYYMVQYPHIAINLGSFINIIIIFISRLPERHKPIHLATINRLIQFSVHRY